MGTIIKKLKFSKLDLVVICLFTLILIFVFHNPINSKGRMSETVKCMIGNDGIKSEYVDIVIGEDDTRTVLNLISKSFSVRVFPTKSEHMQPGCYGMLINDELQLIICRQNSKPRIYCVRYTDSWVLNTEWFLYPTEQQYNEIEEILERYIDYNND